MCTCVYNYTFLGIKVSNEMWQSKKEKVNSMIVYSTNRGIILFLKLT